MGKVYFVFGIHNHQPVGNFHHIFEYAYDRCYKPLLETLVKFPKVKFALHTSGPLYDWFWENKKDYVSLLKDAVKRGQMEVIGGGYYEPILPLVSDEDKRRQINLMSEFIGAEFKNKPQGMWLAERVWEPGLAGVINSCGIDYTFLDDTHFRWGGLEGDEFLGYYTTECDARPLHVFPISKLLRYKMPFGTAQEAIDALNKFVGEGDTLITFFDDGEKFGLWPKTYEWVYEKKWLETFLSYLSDSTTVETIHPSQAIAKFYSNGLAYLPTCSYEEMGEWVLEPHDHQRYEKFKKYLKDARKYEEFKNFVRGGFFRNFYRKYPRLNYMHKRMLKVSRDLYAKTTPEKDPKIFTDLWKAQTNCGYWHGVFGGFYLGHIRGAVYENLIRAQNAFDKKYLKSALPVVEEEDIDLDGMNEIVVRNEKAIMAFSRHGATLLELGVRDPAMNLLNTVTRREESYHQKILERETKSNEVASIHDATVMKEKDLDKYLIYDSYERLGLVDHLVAKDMTLQAYNHQQGVVSLSRHLYDCAVKKSAGKVAVKAVLRTEDLGLTKTITIADTCGFSVQYEFDNAAAFKAQDFAVEFNLFLPSPDHIFAVAGKEVPLNGPQEFGAQKTFTVLDKHSKIALKFTSDEARVLTMPVYTVSSSESGLEKAYQELAVLFVAKNPGTRFRLVLEVKKQSY